MPSAKHNSKMERATGLISSLLDVASSRDMPFCQPQQPHSKHHGVLSSFVPVLFADNVRLCRLAIARNGFPLPFLKQHVFIAEKFLTLLFICNAV